MHHEVCRLQRPSRHILSLADGARSIDDMRILLTAGSDSDSHEFAEAISCNDASSESQLQQLVEDAIRGLTQSGF
jgi:hypothetical protein